METFARLQNLLSNRNSFNHFELKSCFFSFNLQKKPIDSAQNFSCPSIACRMIRNAILQHE